MENTMTPNEALTQLIVMARAAIGNALDHEKRAEAEQILAAIIVPASKPVK